MTSADDHVRIDNKCIPPRPALALARKGPQDEYEHKYSEPPSKRPDLTHEGFYDVRKDVLKGEHVWTYGRLDAESKLVTKTWWRGDKCMSFTLKRTCDWINAVELAICQPYYEFKGSSVSAVRSVSLTMSSKGRR